MRAIVRRQRGAGSRLLPRSVTELVVAIAISYLALTMALGVALLIVGLVVLI
jgi:hypothetical protein